MGKYSVTFAQYDLFCEATGREKPFGFSRENLPVSRVNWDDAKAFAEWMNCRLPTEAEWEYAARANTTTPFYTGNSLTHAKANFDGKGPLPVGSFPPNAFGLFDMHGNIWEWCNDWYGAYGTTDVSNPQGSDTGKRKIIRGGGWRDPASKCRSAFRCGGEPPGARGTGIGFRLVKSE
jgi:formylglycine-generating enzyme required for sulfatase activity